MLSIELVFEIAGGLSIAALLYAHYKLHLSLTQIKNILAAAADAANRQKKP